MTHGLLGVGRLKSAMNPAGEGRITKTDHRKGSGDIRLSQLIWNDTHAANGPLNRDEDLAPPKLGAPELLVKLIGDAVDGGLVNTSIPNVAHP